MKDLIKEIVEQKNSLDNQTLINKPEIWSNNYFFLSIKYFVYLRNIIILISVFCGLFLWVNSYYIDFVQLFLIVILSGFCSLCFTISALNEQYDQSSYKVAMKLKNKYAIIPPIWIYLHVILAKIPRIGFEAHNGKINPQNQKHILKINLIFSFLFLITPIILYLLIAAFTDLRQYNINRLANHRDEIIRKEYSALKIPKVDSFYFTINNNYISKIDEHISKSLPVVDYKKITLNTKINNDTINLSLDEEEKNTNLKEESNFINEHKKYILTHFIEVPWIDMALPNSIFLFVFSTVLYFQYLRRYIINISVIYNGIFKIIKYLFFLVVAISLVTILILDKKTIVNIFNEIGSFSSQIYLGLVKVYTFINCTFFVTSFFLLFVYFWIYFKIYPKLKIKYLDDFFSPN